MLQNTQEPRPIYKIALDIKKDWKKVYFGAVPYLSAMLELNTIKDKYYLDSAESVVLHFLSNASTYRGEKAKAIKLELKQLLKGK